jgi:cytochrome oxidase Cu insertion factor (SCO1/SenC/PrrC family)
VKRNAWPLLALVALFVGPLVAAVLLYAGRDSLGGFGQLENPDREFLAEPPLIPLAPLTLTDGSTTDPAWARSRWSLLYARTESCELACQAAILRLHQVWLSLGGERDRVQTILLVPARSGGTEVPADFLVGLLETSGNDALVHLLGPERLARGRYFVIDPLGNVILSYPDDADQGRLLKDLERLLAVSRVG